MAALKAQVVLLAVYLEQVAVDGGRHQLGWLLTGMPNPPFQLVQAHSQRAQEDPAGFLGEPRWVAANFAHLKDMDYLESRVAQSLWAASRRPRTGLERRRARQRHRRRELRRQRPRPLPGEGERHSRSWRTRGLCGGFGFPGCVSRSVES